MTNPLINRQRGKAAERAVAKMLGGERLGILGGEDVGLDNFSIEVKSRKSFVAQGWFCQAVKNCPDGKIPLVIVHVNGKQHDNDFMMMRLSDFKAIIEPEDSKRSYGDDWYLNG